MMCITSMHEVKVIDYGYIAAATPAIQPVLKQ